ncbi:hypothetical protein OEG84_25260 [Hoeflea sp. G2-23]|uniref:Uncharacterized protein n=1 Tax=Hoeflea algicola TaxID=2983763 RepID=A0ABT3ZH08_9HYPH|nr:hypothetical protein [Hoeflea algicola]MCY0150594.1 hypothetical protein [Hoeflea algicola]MCY0150918.1 hypothetical protein [Hoeflea algicola]
MGNYPQTRTPKERTMSGVTVPSFNSSQEAHDLIKRIAFHCWDSKSSAVDRVYDAITEFYPHWTRRRVRGLFHKEAAKIDWREIRELEVISQIEAQRRETAKAKRADHNDFLNSISNTLSHMEATDAEFYSQHRQALREMAFGQAHQSRGNAASKSDQDTAVGRANIGATD